MPYFSNRSVDLLETGTKLILERERYLSSQQHVRKLQELGSYAWNFDPIVWVFIFICVLFITVLIVRFFMVQKERQELLRRIDE